MKTLYYNVYQFNELTKEAQETAIENLRDINTDYEWYDYEIEYWIEKLDAIGFENAEINFSGFWSQGDGASFTSSVNLEKLISYMIYCSRSYKDIKTFYKLDTLRLASLIDLDFSISRNNSRYSHENTCYVSCDFQGFSSDKFDTWLQSAVNKLQDEIEEIRYSLCQDIYISLRKEYEYLTSDEGVKETIEANEYDFLENGKLA